MASLWADEPVLPPELGAVGNKTTQLAFKYMNCVLLDLMCMLCLSVCHFENTAEL